MTWAFSVIESDGLVCYLFSRAPTTFKTEKNVDKPHLIYDKNCAVPPRICGFQEMNSGNNDYYRVMKDTTPQACHQACKDDQKCSSFMTWGFSVIKSDGPVCFLYSTHAEAFKVRTEYSELKFVHDKECPTPA